MVDAPTARLFDRAAKLRRTPDAQDLLELGNYQCYARVSDAQLAATLARLSAERYGRDALDVELDLRGALERIRGPRRTADAHATDAPTGPPEPAAPDIGTPAPAAVIAGAEVPTSTTAS